MTHQSEASLLSLNAPAQRPIRGESLSSSLSFLTASAPTTNQRKVFVRQGYKFRHTPLRSQLQAKA